MDTNLLASFLMTVRLQNGAATPGNLAVVSKCKQGLK